MSIELHFLGTGSAFPSPKRSSSCTAFRHEKGIWIFDCGEGSQIQIQKSNVKPARVSAIFITHLHGDHVFGLPGMLCTISQALDGHHIDIYGPHGLKNFLRCSLALSFSNLSYTYSVHEVMVPSVEEFIKTTNIELDTNFWGRLNDLSKHEFPPHPNETEGTSIHMNEHGFYEICHRENFNVFAGPLKHTVPCIGYIIQEENLPGKLDVTVLKERGVPVGPLYGKIKSGQSILLDSGEVIKPQDCLGPERPGRKIVILGDTYCSDSVMELALGADVLVHESTNENADKEKSILHGHSTAAMAGEFGRKIAAKKLVLTHFSQRYRGLNEQEREDTKSVSVLLQEAIETFNSSNVVVAEDLLVVTVPLPR